MFFADPAQAALWLSVSCAVLFLLYLPVQVWELCGQVPRVTTRFHLRHRFKLIIGPILAIILFVSLLQLHGHSQFDHINGPFFTSLLVSALSAIGLSPLLYLEQRISLSKSSDLATLYLIGSIGCDSVILTTPHLESTPQEASLLPVLARCIAHISILLLEGLGGGPSTAERVKNSLSAEEGQGVLSRVFFLWINPILARGYRHVLTGDGLPYLNPDLKPRYIRHAMLEAWRQRAKPETKMTLPLALYRCLKGPFLAAIIPRLFLVVFRYSQPILIRRSIHYVTSPASGDWNSTGYRLIVTSVIVYMGLVISTATYHHRLNRLKLCTKSAFTGLIHEKMISLPSATSEDGEAITLMNTDAEGLDGIAEMFHETWAQVLEVVIGMTLLARQVGWLWLLLVFLIFLCSRMSRYVARNLQLGQKDWNVATQTRIAATAIMLNSMKVVKMLGIQNRLAERIQWLRMNELLVASRVRWMMVYANAAANALGIFSPAITIALFATWLKYAQGANLDAEIGFTTLAILSRVTHPANMVMTIVPRAVAAFSGFERIQAYLMKPALVDGRLVVTRTAQSNINGGPPVGLRVKHMAASYINLQGPVLEDINIDVAPGSFVIVSGPIGCGKSALLRALLGEMAVSRGSIAISTKRIAYCAQKPWLPGGSIQGIVTGFADQYNLQWYREVVEACCLAHDLDALPEMDETEVGSGGQNLSGGQRQRVALARAVFASNDIVLLDDTFSALDGETEYHVFENLLGFRGLLRRLRTTVVLVSNNAQHYVSADSVIILGDDGRIKEQGPWQTLQAKTATVSKFMTTTASKSVDAAPAITKNFDRLGAQLRAMDEAGADLARQTGDFTLYHYFFSFAGFRNLALVTGCTATYSLFVTLPQYWLELWTDSDSGSATFYIVGLLAIASVAWASTSGTLWGTMICLAPQAGLMLHRHLLGIVTCAPLTFFSMTDTGSILNRFSQDMQLIDKQLPMAVTNICNQIFKLLVQAALLFLAQKWLALSLPAILAIVYIVQKVYLRTSRQLRFLELESKAVVFSSFLESMDGLETLRAFAWKRHCIHSNEQSIENAQRPEFLLLALQRWLNLVLDLLAAALGIIVIVVVVVRREDVSGGQVGVALTVMLAANVTLLRLVESWTALEISLGAVARLKMLEEHTPSESNTALWSATVVAPLQTWQVAGRIEIKDVTASYQSGALGLCGITLSIKAGQKVLVCGRTGSGKSSLLLTLLRMLHLQSGCIEFDGVDISQIPPDELRQRCFVVIAQDPLLLAHEDLRFNLESEGSTSDSMLVQVLTSVGLWSIFQCDDSSQDTLRSDDITSILDKKLCQFPTLSTGQCQLFALARAVLKAKSLRADGARPVVVLDEITSSVDTDTEAKVHGIVDREFSCHGHTVIIITHRMGALADYVRVGRDMIVRMVDGAVQEVVRDITPAVLRRDEVERG